METGKRNLIDRLGGDKVVWLILLLLMLLSLVGIASATSSMASGEKDRMDIIVRQLVTIGVGLVVIFALYAIPRTSWLRRLSRFGFLFCMAALLFLDMHINAGVVRAASINGAWRIIKVGGFQLHILELVKVVMVLYLAWAVDTYKSPERTFTLQLKLSELPHLKWLAGDNAQKWINIYLPMFLVCMLALPAGTSNTVFIGGILFLTLILAGMPFGDFLRIGVLGVIAVAMVLGVFFLERKVQSDPSKRRLYRLETALSDSRSLDKNIAKLKEAQRGTVEYQEAMDLIRQPYGAKMAIKRGGFPGKGPGKSTMKYVVPVIYEDYMFSFLIEEYGLLIGGIFVIILYISLLARGAIIARNCRELFDKVAVGGLAALITGQAMMHILVNCEVGIQTGQTLPLISFGASAFLCFSAAFGIILSISRHAEQGVWEETMKAEALMTPTGDEVQDGLETLDVYDSAEEFGQSDIEL